MDRASYLIDEASVCLGGISRGLCAVRWVGFQRYIPFYGIAVPMEIRRDQSVRPRRGRGSVSSMLATLRTCPHSTRLCNSGVN